MGTRDELVDVVTRILGEPVTFDSWIRKGMRAWTARLQRSDGSTVVAKGPVRPIPEGDEWRPRFHNEVAALEVLDGLEGMAPQFLGADHDSAWVVMNDFGDLPGLHHALTGSDRAAAMAAIERWAAGLARFHSASAPLVDRWEARRADFDASWHAESATKDVRRARRALDGVFDIPVSVDEAAEEIDRRLSDRSWWALSPRDTCPDNCAIRPDGSVLFFDFEAGGAHHRLLDIAYLVTPFPSCWCAGALLDDAREAGLAAYRLEIDSPDGSFDVHLAAAAAYFALWQLSSFRLPMSLGDDGGKGWFVEKFDFESPSPRGAVALTLDTVERAVAGDEALDPIADLARDLRSVLTERWGSWDPSPPHPAFR